MKLTPFLRFGVTFVHATEFMLANLYICHALFSVGAGSGVGDYLKYSPEAAKLFLLCWEHKCAERVKKKQSSL